MGETAGSAWPRIAVIGAGMSGIAAVIKLRDSGYGNVTVFEKADRIGGTWRENHYPGVACDVASLWYSYSFEPNPDWSQRCAPGDEIQAYLEHTVKKYDLGKLIRFGVTVAEIRFTNAQWHLQTDAGEHHVFDIVISATGILHHPVVPAMPGLESFAGRTFHSARWDHSAPLAGQRYGVIGTGSTACQIVSTIAGQVSQLNVFQRTPQWILPVPQKTYSDAEKRLRRKFPVLTRFLRAFWRVYADMTLGMAITGNRPMQRLLEFLALRNLRVGVADPALRQALTPDYLVTCKRIIYSNDFYPAMSRSNVTLTTAAIERIEPEGVRTADGTLHPLDVLVFATGFDASRYILPTRVIGESGRELASVWDGSPRAHRAMCLPDFPNFWMLQGPSGPIGNFSLVEISEAQLDYIIQCLDEMGRRGSNSVSVKRDAFTRYNEKMAVAVKKTSYYSGGCSNWYLDKSGLPNVYPWLARRYFREIKRPQFSEFTFGA